MPLCSQNAEGSMNMLIGRQNWNSNSSSEEQINVHKKNAVQKARATLTA